MGDQTDQTLVERFADDLRKRIEGGEYGTSGIIPSLTELGRMWNTHNRALTAEVVMLLRAQGYLMQSANKRYRVVYPRIILPGLTPNFKQFLVERGLTPVEEDIEPPKVESMPRDIALMFVGADDVPAIREGVHVVHRQRRQGIIDQPLRIGHIWYPLDIAKPYLEALQKDSGFDMPAALKKDSGISLSVTDTVIRARVPELEETKELKLARYQPVLDIRRIGYTANRERVITLHRTIMDATRFDMRLTQEVDHWK